jgi:hypothetical protein
VSLIEGQDGQGQFDDGEYLADIIVQFHGNRLESCLLDFQLGAQQFLLVFVFHAHQLLFLPMLPALVEE